SSLGDDTDEEDVDEDSDSEGSNLDENMHEDAAAQRDRVKEYSSMTLASTMRSSRRRADTKTANRVSRMGHATAIFEAMSWHRTRRSEVQSVANLRRRAMVEARRREREWRTQFVVWSSSDEELQLVTQTKDENEARRLPCHEHKDEVQRPQLNVDEDS
ncbi:hypothetical protein PC128_g23145, partial [Phytophthora cactorum]